MLFVLLIIQMEYQNIIKPFIEGIIGEKPDFECKISIYRLFCPKLLINKYEEENIENLNIAIRLTSLQSQPINIKIQRADIKPKKFIACPSRLFAFDQWHLFITTLELFRLHRVNLVIIYIQSVEAQVYNLIKAYESSGFVQIRPSLEMPSINTGLNYNPNSETSWQNQLTNFQDCLYEFKESSEFIAFPDWDDFFFTSDYSIPYYPILKKFSDENPKVNTFIIDRYMGFHESLDEMNKNGHKLNDFWRQGIKYSTKDTQYFYGKAIYKPNRGLYGVDLHWANRVEPGYKEIRIPLKEAYIIHARDYSK
ncbi:C-type lectin domain-containing protein [Meloidogyne graminicola]|uniref:Glycosyltransferase family 92 protein n=1 Tax=Meloidogyne graminicola TaxID=189291 RepID=A0A8S9ZRU0_9BILA|nr:C-type lectin domain-containing protein [Meloidogyne graminicola]